MDKKCLHLSEDTYICSTYSGDRHELDTDRCNSLDWFLDEGISRKRSRVVNDKLICEAIYYPTEGYFTDFHSSEKSKACSNI